jgi:hypothetical protein
MKKHRITIAELKRKNPKYFQDPKNIKSTGRLFADKVRKIKTRNKTGDKYLIESKKAVKRFLGISYEFEVFEIRKIEKNLKLGRAKRFTTLEAMESFLEMQ